MGALRRSHCAALAALGALLLLLLARLPPQPFPPQPPPAAPQPTAPPQPPAAQQPSAPQQPPAVPLVQQATHSPSSPASTTNRSVESTPLASAAVSSSTKRVPHAVLTGELYEAGHTRPHPELCPALGARLRLLVLVTSAPSHAAARQAVRLTWGHFASRTDVAMGFVLGAPPPQLRAALDAEDALYGDIIEGRSVDSYSNLTLKTLSMLEWVDTYCPRAPHFLKTDDDMFINIPRLLDFAKARENATKTIWGKVVRKSLPKRTTKSKYYVSPEQFPGRVFPDFATGPAYLMSADCVRPLLLAAPSERYLRLEDVFVTGVLASRLGVRRTHAAQFYNKKVAPHPCAVQRGLAIHMVQYHEQFDLWRKLLDGKSKCAA